MDYLDFEVRVGASTSGDYPTLVVESLADHPSGTMSAAVVPTVLRAGLELAGAEHAQRRRGSRKAVPDSGDALTGESVRSLGEELFRALVSADVFASYQSSILLARERGKGLRLRLRLEAPELAALPWEFLFDPKVTRDYLALSRETPLVRVIDTPLGAETLTVQPPVHVLGMIGCGEGLDVEKEKRNLARAVEPLTERGMLTVTWVPGNDWRSLSYALAHGTFHVFHFIGHGGFDATCGEGSVLLGGEGGDGKHRLSASDLAGLLRDHQRTLKLVVLNSCEGARGSATELVSSVGATLSASGIPAVISMQFEITDDAAIAFSRTFYDALAEERAVDDAVSAARRAMRLSLQGSPEWATPVLHMRSPDGRIFRMDLASALFPIPAAPLAPRPVVVPSGATPPRAPLLLLLRKVREFWVTGVLARSLARMDRLRLDVSSVASDVQSLWSGMLDTPEVSRRLEDPRSMSHVFEEQGSSLLILGEPGAGKTVALLELAGDLLQQAEQDPDRPVPVVFNLSSWGGSALPLVEWIKRELSAKYQIPTRASDAWIVGGKVLPLFDGLDEVAEGQRSACVDAINAYVAEPWSVGAVTCCRLKEYLALPNRLALNGAIRIQSLSTDAVLALLSGAGARLAGLHALLERDLALLQDARSPLMLSLMVSAFEGVPPDAVIDARGLAMAERRRAIMLAFVDRAYGRARAGAAVA